MNSQILQNNSQTWKNKKYPKFKHEVLWLHYDGRKNKNAYIRLL